jgi:hypothetical protein
MRQYLKFAAQVAATAVAAIAAAIAGDDKISATEWVNVLILALGAVAVLGAGNLPAGVWAYTKGIVASSTAGAVFLQSAITDGMSSVEWLQLTLAILGAAGVLAVKGPRVYDAASVGRHVAGLRSGPSV